MPRRPRVFVAGAIYHVYCRTARQERIFADAREAQALLDILRDVRDRDGLAILAWSLMPTHYHLALRTGEVPLWRSMRLVQGRFAQSYNRRHKNIGGVWQERYKAKLVNDASYLARLLAYIHLNPVVAGLASKPGGWRWSGHREIVGRSRAPLVDRGEFARLLGDDEDGARRAYLALVRAISGESWFAGEPGQLAWWRRQPREADTAGQDARRPRLDAQGSSTGLARPQLDAATLVERACATLGVDRERIASSRRDRQTVRQRELLVLLGVERYGVRTKDIAAILGTTADQVSRWVGRAHRRRGADDHFRVRFEALDVAVAAGHAE